MALMSWMHVRPNAYRRMAAASKFLVMVSEGIISNITSLMDMVLNTVQ
jgi:hypothetical protein